MNNEEIKIKEPFKGLFTQGMVCETYKDDENNCQPGRCYYYRWKKLFPKK